ncbi:DNA polymerase III subunit delta' [Streptococcus himalayensis]|uniref:DNA polymerase III subunit delta n=1 Tax=Streptococcus himalayensis TaxID=1888195 RepID=A0A917A9T6_9STRE|nr:DNA polymerase III subunit delta' [Streptococcus himalayensis]GGE37800.1 DNA polymerase III subunit delta' [Streptococcus himalayensis]
MKEETLRIIQPEQIQRFEKILEQKRLHHAYLFTGAFASFEMAQFLAQALFCEEKKGVFACGRCRNCRLIEEEAFSDVTVLRPTNQLIKTETIRELVRKFSQSGIEGNRQVFIICEADKMHVHAANSLLKVIEEPQSEIYVFFLASDAEKILPTIRSRTQVFHFPKSHAYLVHRLEQEGLMRQQADMLATYAQSEAEALGAAKSTSFMRSLDEVERFVKSLLNGQKLAYVQVSSLVHLADDKEKQAQILRLIEVCLAKEIMQPKAQFYLTALSKTYQMWQANVSFQNALEYMVLNRQSSF